MSGSSGSPLPSPRQHSPFHLHIPVSVRHPIPTQGTGKEPVPLLGLQGGRRPAPPPPPPPPARADLRPPAGPPLRSPARRPQLRHEGRSARFTCDRANAVSSWLQHENGQARPSRYHTLAEYKHEMTMILLLHFVHEAREIYGDRNHVEFCSLCQALWKINVKKVITDMDLNYVGTASFLSGVQVTFNKFATKIDTIALELCKRAMNKIVDLLVVTSTKVVIFLTDGSSAKPTNDTT
ncbi:hypothetical protein EVAR_15145_1 [Eumeta japonica]|uniref:Uncharacterized protein n=1 Tax=Eumeta variegata TaxID=151549 RepID=A0A4C1UI38_EUMVA|nr:hypothetical protein EVAR_15145_1 [Eumeta japonica]